MNIKFTPSKPAPAKSPFPCLYRWKGPGAPLVVLALTESTGILVDPAGSPKKVSGEIETWANFRVDGQFWEKVTGKVELEFN